MRDINENIGESLKTIRRAMAQDLAPEDLQIYDMDKTLSQIVTNYPFSEGEREKFHWERKNTFKFRGNSLLFSRVMNNLIKNAYEQIQQNGRGEIFLSLEHQEEKFLLRLRDTAGGAPREVVEKMFSGFFTTKEGGTGVGLPFCQRTLRAFGGDIVATSVEGDFMEFVLVFPKSLGIHPEVS